MADIILTPSQVWENYNLESTPLEMSIVSLETISDITVKTISFTSENTVDGKVVAYARFFYNSTIQIKVPGILVCNSIDNELKDEHLAELAKQGFFVATFDYIGLSTGDQNHTKYPPSLSFCSNPDKITTLNKTPNDIPIFHWTLIAIRVISLMIQDSLCSKTNISTIGVLNGADIMWQLAAMDKRIKSCISILNMGWHVESNLLKQNNKNVELTQYQEVYKIGYSPEAYAGSVKCPILMIGATRNELTAIDKYNDIIDRIPANTNWSLSITQGDDTQLGPEAFSSLCTWLDYATKELTETIPKSPKLQATVDQQISFNYEIDKMSSIVDAKILISSGENNPVLRHWQSFPISIDSKGCGSFKYQVESEYDTVYAFLNIFYKDGFLSSSKLITIDSEDYDSLESIGFTKHRIMYENNMPISEFITQGDNIFSEENDISLTLGPNNIPGLTTTSKILMSFAIGDRKHRGEKNYILHFDIASNTKKTITIQIACNDSTTGNTFRYSSSIQIENTEEWTSIFLQKEDFKPINNAPPLDWANARRIEFINAKNIILNNLLWV